LRWWDINQQKEQVSRLPATTLQVLPSASSADDQTSLIGLKASSNDPSIADSGLASEPEPSALKTISLALNALLIAFIVALLMRQKNHGSRDRTQTTSKPEHSALLTLKQQLKAIEDAAKNDDYMAMRDAILIWGKTLFSERPPKTLKTLAISLQDTDIQQQFERLDRKLYKGVIGDSEMLDIDLLLRHLRQQSTFSRGANQAKTIGHGLKDLYPT
jgi:hypothetical protein